MFLITPIARGLQTVGVLTWDFGFFLLNLVTPNLKVDHVTPQGHLGANGKWPNYFPPNEGDSRCSCPALNAMANHGILPRDGKNISFKDLNAQVRSTYNFAPSFCFFVPNFSANFLKKSYGKDTFDLADLDLHNKGIEHDASLTRQDSALVPNQGIPHVEFVEELLASASGKDKEGNPILTLKDLAAYSSKRRVDARASNPEHYTLDFSHKMFGSSNSSTLLTIFGGRVSDLRSFLIDERIVEGWESRVRSRWGLTFAKFNFTVIPLELSISEKKYRAKLASQQTDDTTSQVALNAPQP